MVLFFCVQNKDKVQSSKSSLKNVLIPMLIKCKQYSFETAFSCSTVSFDAIEFLCDSLHQGKKKVSLCYRNSQFVGQRLH